MDSNSMHVQMESSTVEQCSDVNDMVFALDIGTRSVVGIAGYIENGVLRIVDSEVCYHKTRAMIDGQIQDIDEVSEIVGIVKKNLEDRLGVLLKYVSIAAAGRALITKKSTAFRELPVNTMITRDIVRDIEIEALANAQNEMDNAIEGDISYYCVGHSIMAQTLDDYPMTTLEGHRGSKIKLDMISAFLPSPVVESLYKTMENNGLEVRSLTLEPIAAMNVLIPQELRMLNIALVDIGAGTSDIAISKDGAVFAYDMATVAGDEITETIVKDYIVDFDMAEKMKLALSEESDTVPFVNILGISGQKTKAEIFDTIASASEKLSDVISEKILEINGFPPAAVFLVGGGSQLPLFSRAIARKLNIDASLVAVGGNSFLRKIVTVSSDILLPQFITPIGIAFTSTTQEGYDFYSVTLNGEKVKIFNNNSLTVGDILTTVGFNSQELLGKSGKGITFELNGEKKTVRGEFSVPGEIKVNGKVGGITTKIKAGDDITILTAENGRNVSMRVCDVIEISENCFVNAFGTELEVGSFISANGVKVDGLYEVRDFDVIHVCSLITLGDILKKLDIDHADKAFTVNGEERQLDYVMQNLDVVDFAVEPEPEEAPVLEDVAPEDVLEEPTIVEEPMQAADDSLDDNDDDPVDPDTYMTVTINGTQTPIREKLDGAVYIFADMLNHVDIDPNDPKGEIVIRHNGHNASYLDIVRDGDSIEIYWK